MKNEKTERTLAVLFCAAALALGWSARAVAEPFQNLDFELANISQPPTSDVSATDALPYWTCYGNYLPRVVLYDSETLDAPSISIHDGRSKYPGDFYPMEGRYSVMLQDGAGSGPTDPPLSVYISQVGDVPGDARSVEFTSDRMFTLDRFVVSLNGTTIPMQLYSVGDTINANFGPIETFIGDISAFTGTTSVELRLTKLVQDPSDPYGFSHGQVDLDSITFSSTIVPEPSSLLFLTVAALGTSAYIFRRRPSHYAGLRR